MLAYAIRRLGQSLFVLVLMSFLVFVGVYAIGNPVELLVNPQADEVERVRATAALGPGQALPRAVLGVPQGRCERRPRQVLRLQRAGALRSSSTSFPRRIELALVAMVMAIVARHPAGPDRGAEARLDRRPQHHGRIDPRLQPAHLLGGARAHHGVLGAARLAAVQRSRRDRDGRRHRRELPHRRRARAPRHAGAQPRALQALAAHPAHARRHARGRAAGLRQVRARQGAHAGPRDRRARAEEHPHPDRHRDRPRAGLGDRLRHRDRVDLRVARHAASSSSTRSTSSTGR